MSRAWLWTTRPGAEGDLIEELALSKLAARAVGPSLVSSEGRPAEWPTFARAGFPLAWQGAPDDAAAALQAALGEKPKSFVVRGWVPDADATNPLAPRAEALAESAAAALVKARPELELKRLAAAEEARKWGGLLVELVLAGEDRLHAGALAATEAPILAPGGRARVHQPRNAPSRAGRKLVEALEWLGRAPEAGDVCVDLGAAPGGWSVVLLERRAKVIAVDPAELAPEVRRMKGLTHVKASAFDFVPSEPVDWLCCDMAWRPLEVAQMLAKWGRRRLASALVANLKLPMKQRAEHVAKLRQIVAGGGWQDVKTRQLYHDRDEVTMTAWRA